MKVRSVVLVVLGGAETRLLVLVEVVSCSESPTAFAVGLRCDTCWKAPKLVGF
jgi:hypothetical protein